MLVTIPNNNLLFYHFVVRLVCYIFIRVSPRFVTKSVTFGG
jgi:hypothetical protein